MSSALEATLGRHRAWSMAALTVLTVLAWLWLMNGAGMQMRPFASLVPPSGDEAGMGGMDPAMGPDMAMMVPVAWTAGRFALVFSMWWTMMVAMMLPSAAPMILLYARAAGHGGAATRPSSASFLAGYLVAWGVFSLLATTAHAMLDHLRLIGPMGMASQSRWFSAAILIAAGLYQIGPVKDVCLRHCRNPAQFLSRHFRPGAMGAMRMGLLHGTYCIGCCSLLMALLFVGGVMNLAWIALLAVMVAAEKLLPHGRVVALVTGWACVGWGLEILFG